MSVHGRSRGLLICLAAWLHSLTRRFWVRAFEGAMRHDTGCVGLHLNGRILDRLKHLTRHFFYTEPFNIFALFRRNCRTVIYPSKACNNTTRKSILAISVCNCPLFFQLRNHAYMQPRCPQLAIQIFDHTGQKFDLDFSVQIFERLGVQIFVRLAWFRVNGTPYRNNFRILLRREEQHPVEE